VSTIRYWNHNDSFASVNSHSAGVVPKDSSFLQFPLAPIKMNVGSADASSLKLHEHSGAFNFGFGDFFDFDVVGSTVNSSFQKKVNL
jgi:hypothetical protein